MISLVDTPEPEWNDESIRWEASVLQDLGYIDTREEWQDFMDHMCDHAAAWLQSQEDKAKSND